MRTNGIITVDFLSCPKRSVIVTSNNAPFRYEKYLFNFRLNVRKKRSETFYICTYVIAKIYMGG